MKARYAIPLVVVLIALSAVVGFFAARLVSGPAESLPPPPETAEPTAEPTRSRQPVAGPIAAAQADPGPPGSPTAEWAEKNRRAIAHLEAGELDEAVALFEECHAAMPDEDVFARNLAEALVRAAVRDHEELRPCEHCVEWVERAFALDPSREDLQRLADRWRTEEETERDFWRESSQHFDLAYDGSRDEILWGSHRILAELEEAYTDLGEQFGRYPVEEGRPRISVVLYRREGFDALTGLGDWAGGAFDGTVRVPVGDFELEESRLRRILRHELVHAFVRAVGGPRVPGWLNEGLAQWLEEGRAAAVEVASERLRGAELFSLDQLEGSLASWKDEEAIGLAYAQSLLFCDYLARNYGERVVFGMVEGCAEGTSPAELFEQRTRVALAVVLGDLAEDLR